MPWLFNGVAPADRHSYFGFPNENYLKTSDDILTLRAEHQFSPNVNLHTIARAAHYPRQAQITEPQICSNAPASVPVGGIVSALPTLAYNTAKILSIHSWHTGGPDHTGQSQSDPGKQRRGSSLGPD